MLSIDEAIKHAREVAGRNRKIISSGYDGEFCIAELYADDTEAINEVYDRCEQSAEEHEQLAEWLEELQLYKQGNCTNDCEHFDNGVKYGYEKGVDDFAERLEKHCLYKKIYGIFYT